MKASSKHNHLNDTTPRFRLDRDHYVGHVFLSVVYMPTMNYSCVYLTELRPIEKCVNLQHFVTERVIDIVQIGGRDHFSLPFIKILGTPLFSLVPRPFEDEAKTSLIPCVTIKLDEEILRLCNQRLLSQLKGPGAGDEANHQLHAYQYHIVGRGTLVGVAS